MKLRSGTALAELLTALTLLGMVGAAGTVLLHAGSLVLRHTTEHAAADEAIRTAAAVVQSELRSLASMDVRSVSADSISARIARGIGIVCDTTRDVAVLRYRGLRLPDPSKDSLLVLGLERATVFRTVMDADARCLTHGDEQVVALHSEVTLRPGNVVMLFETGAYHIATHALRYRRGTEPRQPLTDELLDHRASRFLFDSRGKGVRLLLRANVAGASLLSETQFRFLNP